MRHSRNIILCLLLAIGQAGAACAGVTAVGDGPHVSMALMESGDCGGKHSCNGDRKVAGDAGHCVCGDGGTLVARTASLRLKPAFPADGDAALLLAIPPGTVALSGAALSAPVAWPDEGVGLPLTLVFLNILLLI